MVIELFLTGKQLSKSRKLRIKKGRAPQIYKNLCKSTVYVENICKIEFFAAHIDIMLKTSFSAFIDMEPIVVDEALLSNIIKCHVGGDKFIIGGKTI